MSVLYLQRLNPTRATSLWSDELAMIKFDGMSSSGLIFPTATRGLLNCCTAYTKTFACRVFSPFLSPFRQQLKQKLGQIFNRNWAAATNTPILASDRESIDSDMRGRKRIKATLASRPFLARRFQLNQGALSPVEVDRACDARRKQSP